MLILGDDNLLNTQNNNYSPGADFYGGTFRTFIIFILENIFRGHDKISCSNGKILCAYEIALHANDLSNHSHDLLICAYNLIFRTNDLIKRAHEIFIPAKDIIIRWHDY